MTKEVISRHIICNRGRHRTVQKGSIVLVLDCTHAVLGTQSEDGNRVRMDCPTCATSERAATKTKIQQIEAELLKLKKSLLADGSAELRAAVPMRKDRTELRKQLLAALSNGRKATSRQLAQSTGTDIDAVCRTLGNMADVGQVVRAGKAEDNLLLWSAAPTLPQLFREVYAAEMKANGFPPEAQQLLATP